MPEEHPVVEGLRATLAASRRSAKFVSAVGERVHQLVAGMVDGRVVPKPEADALRGAIVELVRAEALPKFAARNPADAIAVLDKLEAYGFTQLAGERAALRAALAAKFPPPPAATWPELAELHAAAAAHSDVCRVGPPVASVDFAKELEDEGLALPDDLLALYAACESIELACVGAPHLPVFSLPPPRSLDPSEEEDGYPHRQAVFQGGDEVQLAVYRDRKGTWWLVYESEYHPIAKKPLDLRELLRFGLRRMRAASADELLDPELSWERFFGVDSE